MDDVDRLIARPCTKRKGESGPHRQFFYKIEMHDVDRFDCKALHKKARDSVVHIGNSFLYGVSHSYSQSNTQTWGTCTTKSVTNGFTFYGYTLQTTVTGSSSHTIAEETSNTFSTTNTTSIMYHYQPGVV
jgi:hypothetical protein